MRKTQQGSRGQGKAGRSAEEQLKAREDVTQSQGFPGFLPWLEPLGARSPFSPGLVLPAAVAAARLPLPARAKHSAGLSALNDRSSVYLDCSYFKSYFSKIVSGLKYWQLYSHSAGPEQNFL